MCPVNLPQEELNILGCSITDWLQIILTVTGGIYALWLFRQSNKEKRNLYVAEIMNKFYDDIEIRTVIYAVDSGRDSDEIKFTGKLEQQADKTIKYLDYIGYLLEEGRLKTNDIKPFRYEITRLLKSDVVKKYIKWLSDIGVSLENLKSLEKTVEKHWL
jgi:hypothetical protein